MNAESMRILVVDDEEIIRDSFARWLEQDGYTVGSAQDGKAGLARLEAEAWDILIVDLKMPGMHGLEVLEKAKKLRPETVVVIATAYATVDTAVRAMKMGAFDYLVKPFDPDELSLMMQKIATQKRLVWENAELRRALKKEWRFHDLVSKSPPMHKVFELARLAARSSSTILVLGESGTGKEVMARAIHAESACAQAPFVAVSCAALTETLLESELFGHERGAFTGAVARRKGKFEAAHGGTLFLDEVGDISPKMQLDLLRVLEERRFHRVGGAEPIEVDVRIIAATNRDLRKAVQEGAFREDLFYRLNVIPIVMPPLRDRREDVPLLVEYFFERLSLEMKKRVDGVSPEALAALMAHPWPGNVRELRNVLERAAVVARGSVAELADLGFSLPGAAEPGAREPGSLEEMERRHIAEVLSHTAGNVSQAARILGIDRVTLYNKMRKYQLSRPGVEDAAGDR